MSSQYYIPQKAVSGGGFFAPEKAARHIAKVMRHQKGDNITIFDGTGNAWLAKLDIVQGDEVSGTIIEKLPAHQPCCDITVCFAPVSRQSIELMLDLCTQLGCSAFSPVITARTQFDITTRWPEKSVRWRDIMTTACEQCGVPRIPDLIAPRNFAAALRDCAGTKVIASPGAKIPLARFCKDNAVKKITIFIGPEGDFTDEEVESARAAGAEPVLLADYILRAETACAAACAQIYAAILSET